VWAQAGTALGSQTLGRGYWHVFAAYAVVWILVLGWVISIVRRLRRVEERLGNE
jgi:CcmD family protein